MIARFLSGSTGPFVLFLGVMAVIWLWNLWDCLRNPQSPPPLRWYHFTDALPEDRWDLQALNRDSVAPTGEPKAATRPGPCRR
jgi:hypothetical protein